MTDSQSVPIHLTLAQLETLTEALAFAFHAEELDIDGATFDGLYDKLVTAAGEHTDGGA